jgi:hypothetical protein
MQLTLSSSLFSKPPVAPQAVRPPPRPLDAAAMSQLDQIAAQNLQASRQGLGGGAMLLALVGGLVILGSASMWGGGAEQPRKPLAATARPAPAVEVARPQTPAVAVAPPVASPEAPRAVAMAGPLPTTAAPEPALAAAAVIEPVVLVDDAARKARVAKAAEARRKAAQLAQERALAEETQRLQLAQQREAEQVQQQLSEQARQRAAAEQGRLAAAQLAREARRGVGETCAAAGGFVSQQFCQARECRKAERQDDGVCVNLRELEAARLRASAER